MSNHMICQVRSMSGLSSLHIHGLALLIVFRVIGHWYTMHMSIFRSETNVGYVCSTNTASLLTVYRYFSTLIRWVGWFVILQNGWRLFWESIFTRENIERILNIKRDINTIKITCCGFLHALNGMKERAFTGI